MTLFDDASLAMIPAAVKDGKLYSIKPTDGSGDFTFSRGSNLAATRVNKNGLIEKGRENLLLHSNNFNTWVQSGTTRTSGQIGYDGSLDAWEIARDGASGIAFVYQTISTTGVFSFSIYAKANTENWIRMQDTAGGFDGYFDLANGVSGTIYGISASINAVSGATGWYRITITGNRTVSGNFRIFVASDNENSSATGSIYIQDAQVEQGLVATDYIETTTTTAVSGITEDLPRLDYSGGVSCPSLLLESTRTNDIKNSEYTGNYGSQGLVSLTNNFATSPEGRNNAFKALPTTSNGFHLFFQGSMGGNADTYTQSIFAKANGYNFCYIRFDLPTVYAFFDLQNGTTAYTDSGVTSTIVDMGNGWYRCTATMTTSSYQNAVIGIAEAGDSQSNNTFIGDGSSSVLFYGHQSELGSYPSSYIPTYGAAVTRLGDVASETFSLSSTGCLYISLGEQKDDYFTIFRESFPVAPTRNDIAILYSPTSLKVSHNGSIVIDTTGTYDTSSLSTLQLGHNNGLDQINGIVDSFMIFDTILTDAELNALTA